MTMTAAELVASKKHILLDFDGPICAAFAGYGAENISRQLATTIDERGHHVPLTLRESRDPFELLAYANTLRDGHLRDVVEALFRRLEVEAVRCAPPTPYASTVMRELVAGHHAIVIVSNNSEEAVETYLSHHGLRSIMSGVCARQSSNSKLLKPSPYLVEKALHLQSAKPDDCVVVGDSISDILAARTAGVACIGYANKSTKARTLRADALITSMKYLITEQSH